MSDLQVWFDKQDSFIDYDGFAAAKAVATVVGPYDTDQTPMEEVPQKATLRAIEVYLQTVGLAAVGEDDPIMKALRAENLRLKARLQVAADRANEGL